MQIQVFKNLKLNKRLRSVLYEKIAPAFPKKKLASVSSSTLKAYNHRKKIAEVTTALKTKQEIDNVPPSVEFAYQLERVGLPI